MTTLTPERQRDAHRLLTSIRGRRNPWRFAPSLRPLDDRVVPSFLGPFNAVPQLGSMVYEADGGGHLDPVSLGGAADTFTLTLDPGQTVTVAVSGTGAFQPDVKVLDSYGAVVGAATADPGGVAVVQTVKVGGQLSGGSTSTYQVVVGDVGAASGDYALRVVLNAAVETGGTQSLDAAFVRLHGSSTDTTTTPQAARAAVLGTLSGAPGGGTVAEVEVNNPPPPGLYDFAQNLDGAGWNTTFNEFITDSTTVPHVSVQATGNDTFDYFSFTVPAAGARGIFDVDFENFEPVMYLYDAAGNVVTFNDDGPGDPGDNGPFATYIDWTFAAPGTYTLALGRFGSADFMGQLVNFPVATGDVYTLHFSVAGHAPGAGGDPVAEVEPNDPSAPHSPFYSAFAQNLDTSGDWVLNADPNFYQPETLPHLAVNGTGDGTYDYYTVTVPDSGGLVNVGLSDDTASWAYPGQVFVYDLAGNVLGTATPTSDALLTLPGGTYVLAVGTSATVNTGGLLDGIAPAAGDAYSLYVSVEGHPHAAPAGAADLYTFSLGTGESATLTVAGVTAGATVQVELLDAGGAVLATGTADAANVGAAIRGFASSAGGTYTARVTGGPGGAAYNLVVTRDATTDLESNGSMALAQPFVGPVTSGRRWVTGGITAGDTDFYRVTGDAGAVLTFDTSTPGGGSGAFGNLLDPVLRLYNSAGQLVATNDNGSDGRNASIKYKVPSNAAGTYYVSVSASLAACPGANVGEYILAVRKDSSSDGSGTSKPSTSGPSSANVAPPTKEKGASDGWGVWVG